MKMNRLLRPKGRRCYMMKSRFIVATSLLLLCQRKSSAFIIKKPLNHPTVSSVFNDDERIRPLEMSAVHEEKQAEKQYDELSNSAVVSVEAEALSHSSTTMKLKPGYELFQILPEEEGGKMPPSIGGNNMRDGSVLKAGIDELEGLQLLDYGKKKIDTFPDPFKLVEKELRPFSKTIKELTSTDQPILSMAAKNFFENRHDKNFRPTLVQLVAKAVAVSTPEEIGSSNVEDFSSWEWSGASDIEIEGGIVTAENHEGSDVWRRQAQLGQIVEMIHVASLIHDEVLDEGDKEDLEEHKLYSNKVAVLAGDYLLARASVLLSRLENNSVVQIIATALESLVAGEIMQQQSPPESLTEMKTYLRKSYYKTASLICYACRSTAMLGGHSYGSTVATACEEFGFHLGLALQIQDDILDFTNVGRGILLAQRASANMDMGVSTAPILYAAQEFPHLQPLIMRRFSEKGDKKIVLEGLKKSKTAMDKSKALMHFHSQKAIDALLRLPPSEARNSLVRLTYSVVTRKK